ncbi:MAG: AraC family transcriptional regulator [Fusobacterium sp. JB019]|nr:AraC family transcriptional regulator [Fusobacterium sp. JB020]MDP0506760.1 AraC family transcriptional regulator [Fusobacterium sp. JB019]
MKNYFLKNFIEDKYSIKEVYFSEKKTALNFLFLKGKGEMIFYSIFPGITVIYNKFYTYNCPEYKKKNKKLIEINYCFKGRFECKMNDNKYIYLKEKDLSINLSNPKFKFSLFPMGYYEGISICINPLEFNFSISNILKEFSINTKDIIDKFLCKEWFFLINSNKKIVLLFQELYNLLINNKYNLIKIKTLEILIFINNLSLNKSLNYPKYYSKEQVEKVKHIRNHITKDLTRHITLQDLAKEHNISLTALKACFKNIYGKSVYSYFKECRILYAVSLIKTTNKTIAEIASTVGYDNPSKFSAAFKQHMTISPSNFRKKFL